METLIIARHGYACYEKPYHLTKKGREEAADLAERLRPFAKGGKVVLISSVLDRAIQTAEPIAAVFGVDNFEKRGGLVECCSDREGSEILDLFEEVGHDAETVILVAHRPFSEGFPFYFGEHVLGTALNPEKLGLRNGEAWVIDCSAKTIQRV